MDMARREGGIVVNADSMQVYSILRVLTARPTDDDLARAPHALYGHVHPAQAYSTGAWLRDVANLQEAGAFAGCRPIFTGGTGLYFRALAEGLSQMPDVPAAVRERWRDALAVQGAQALHAALQDKDPAAATAIRPGDGQRIVRALEVFDASGRSILDWQARKGRPLIDRSSAQFFVIQPERETLVRRIERRFDAMIADGALEEVEALSALQLDPGLPATRAIGFRELKAVLDGEISLPEAIERAKAATRQYAKRQATWFRNQFGGEWRTLAGAP